MRSHARSRRLTRLAFRRRRGVGRTRQRERRARLPRGRSQAGARRPNRLKPRRKAGAFSLLLRRLRARSSSSSCSPASSLSSSATSSTRGSSWSSFCVSGLLGFWQERGAAGAVESLLVRPRQGVGAPRRPRGRSARSKNVVPGDVIILNAGDVIPGDCLVLESRDFSSREAALTGETCRSKKAAGLLARRDAAGPTDQLPVPGHARRQRHRRALVVRTGPETEFGPPPGTCGHPPETQFERGLRRFGYLLMEVTLLLVIAIFAVNVALAGPSSTPSSSRSPGRGPDAAAPAGDRQRQPRSTAPANARRSVIVKRLAAIEDFGSMDVLCSDKTGTLTEGIGTARRCPRASTAARASGCSGTRGLNAASGAGFQNPIDAALLAGAPAELGRAPAGRDPLRLQAQTTLDPRRHRRHFRADHEGRGPESAYRLHIG